MIEHDRSEWSLVFFTVLTQLAVGAYILWGLTAGLLPCPNTFNTGFFPVILLYSVLACLVLGALSAVTHLGRPVGALFSISNWRTSWLSREALLAAGFGVVVLVTLILRLRGVPFGLADRLVIFVGLVSGLSLVFGISRLYRLRTVPAWDNLGTPLAFITTSLLTGAVMGRLIWSVLSLQDVIVSSPQLSGWVLRISNLIILLLVAVQATIFTFLVIYLNQKGGAGGESIRILWRRYRSALVLRWLAAGVGLMLLIFGESAAPHFLAYLLLFTSEIIGRFLFYAFYQRTGY